MKTLQHIIQEGVLSHSSREEMSQEMEWKMLLDSFGPIQNYKWNPKTGILNVWVHTSKISLDWNVPFDPTVLGVRIIQWMDLNYKELHIIGSLDCSRPLELICRESNIYLSGFPKTTKPVTYKNLKLKCAEVICVTLITPDSRIELDNKRGLYISQEGSKEFMKQNVFYGSCQYVSIERLSGDIIQKLFRLNATFPDYLDGLDQQYGDESRQYKKTFRRGSDVADSWMHVIPKALSSLDIVSKNPNCTRVNFYEITGGKEWDIEYGLMITKETKNSVVGTLSVDLRSYTPEKTLRVGAL